MRNAILTEDVAGAANTLLPVCRALEGCRIFLTGGTGFFGKWLLSSFIQLREICDLDVSLTILSRDPKTFIDAYPEFAGQTGLEYVTGDVRTFTLPADKTFDYVIHGATAASAAMDRADPDEMYAVITNGTRRMLDFTRRCGASRLLFVSSGAVYGPQPPALSHLPETFDGVPATAYGKGKKVSEQMCLDASADRFECVIARPFAFVGPYLPLDIHYAVGNFIRDALANRPIIISGDGRPCRSYLYAADLAVWLWTLLLSGKNGAAYNVGSPEAISIADLAHLVSRLHGSSSEVHVMGTPDWNVPPSRYVPDTRFAEQSLNLRQSCPLPDAILRTLSFLSDQPCGLEKTAGHQASQT
jgi:dTDP-glucose 4,6-dehydratase